jgi:hypothetical protein
VLDAPHSNIDCFLSGDTRVSSTQLYQAILNKLSVSPPENPHGQE